jgi:competence protein ComEC
VNIFVCFLSLALSLSFWAFSYSPVALILLVAIGAVAFFRDKKIFGLILVSFIVGAILFYSISSHCSGKATIRGIVVKAETNYYLIRTLKGTFYIYSKNGTCEIGDILILSGKYEDISFSHYQESFDFKTYLNSCSAFNSFAATASKEIFHNPIRIRSFKSFLLKGYSSETKILIGSILFKDSAASLTSYSAASNLGISNLLSASGLHISFLFYLIDKKLKKKINGKTVLIIEIIIVIFMAVFSEWALSVVRILIMYILASLENISLAGKKLVYQERLSLAGIIILLFNPLYILNLGFYYTYPVLLFFYFIRSLLKKREKYKKIKTIFLLSFLFLPFRMVAMHGVSPLSFILNGIFAPVFSILYVIDLLVFFGNLTRPFLDIINSGMLLLIGFLSKIDWILPSGEMSYYFVILYYIMLFLMAYFYELRLLKFYKAIKVILCFLLLVCFFPDFSSHYEVHFIDVGQGDSTLIRYKKMNVMVDTGGSISTDMAQQCLIPYLNRLKIRKLDLVMTTHDDYDHSGALESLCNNFPVSQVVKGGSSAGVVQVKDFMIEDINVFKETGAESNYNSSVYSFKIMQTSFLIMGDAPKEVELLIKDRYPNLNADVLKLGHHGAQTSSSEEFVSFLSPSLAIISYLTGTFVYKING